jgi:hypothetical protein
MQFAQSAQMSESVVVTEAIGSTFGSNSYELDSVDYSRSMRPACCAAVASAQLGVR